MSRLIIASLVIFVLASCQSKDEQGTASSAPHSGDTTRIEVEAQRGGPTPLADEPVNDTVDASPYIGDMDAFEATGEYYTTVYYRDGLNEHDSYGLVAARADSLVYEDDEVRRTKIPESIAGKYFNLSGFETISVYNDGNFVTNALFVRVELLEGMIESQFIAVFKPLDPSKFTAEVSYCVSSGELAAKSRDVTWRVLDDSLFTKELLRTFSLGPDPWNSVHVNAMPYDATYSGITFQFKSFLIETHSGKSTILKEINQDYYIGAILPIHLEINGKPVLLIRMGVNETDMVWTSLAVYSGKQYEFLEGNRLEGKVYL